MTSAPDILGESGQPTCQRPKPPSRHAFNGKRVARTLLPDVLPYEPGRPAGYPDGRTLTDDVGDHFVTLFTNGKVTGDGVRPHGDLLAEFPYLGPPHASYDR